MSQVSTDYWSTEGTRRTSLPAHRARRRQQIRRVGRWSLRLVLTAIAAGLIVVGSAMWHAISSRYVATSDATIAVGMHVVTPEVGGRIQDIEVEENQQVTIGEVLFRLDPEPYRLALEMAEAKVLAIRTELTAKRRDLGRLERELEEAERRLGFFESEAERQEDLERRGTPDPMGMDMMVTEVAAAQQRVDDLRSDLRILRADVGDVDVGLDRDPRVREAEAERELAALRLAATELRAPDTGIVAALALQPGAWIEAGQPALGVLDPGRVWIEAEIDQRRIEHVRVGQGVEVEMAAFSGQSWAGRVVSISPATTTVVRTMGGGTLTAGEPPRLPVRIALDTSSTPPPLRAGMTARVRIDTRHETWFARHMETRFSGMGDEMMHQLASLMR